jgi:hypothetical protein
VTRSAGAEQDRSWSLPWAFLNLKTGDGQEDAMEQRVIGMRMNPPVGMWPLLTFCLALLLQGFWKKFRASFVFALQIAGKTTYANTFILFSRYSAIPHAICHAASCRKQVMRSSVSLLPPQSRHKQATHP